MLLNYFNSEIIYCNNCDFIPDEICTKVNILSFKIVLVF